MNKIKMNKFHKFSIFLLFFSHTIFAADPEDLNKPPVEEKKVEKKNTSTNEAVAKDAILNQDPNKTNLNKPPVEEKTGWKNKTINADRTKWGDKEWKKYDDDPNPDPLVKINLLKKNEVQQDPTFRVLQVLREKFFPKGLNIKGLEDEVAEVLRYQIFSIGQETHKIPVTKEEANILMGKALCLYGKISLNKSSCSTQSTEYSLTIFNSLLQSHVKESKQKEWDHFVERLFSKILTLDYKSQSRAEKDARTKDILSLLSKVDFFHTISLEDVPDIRHLIPPLHRSDPEETAPEKKAFSSKKKEEDSSDK